MTIPPFKVLYEAPRIVLFPDFVSQQEADKLLELAEPNYRDSTVVDMETGGPTTNDYRTGELALIDTKADVSIAIQQRVSEVCKTRLKQHEGLQVIKYGVGNQYLPHTDWFDYRIKGMLKVMRQGGQRVFSVIICLKEAQKGGETEFPKLKLKIKLKPREALIFDNLRAEDKVPDLDTTHAGRPVTIGEKVIVAFWIRERAFDGSEEPPNGMITMEDLKKIRTMREEACAADLPKFLEHYNCMLRVVSSPYLDGDGMLNIQTDMIIESKKEE